MKGNNEMKEQGANNKNNETAIVISVKSADGRIETTLNLTRRDAETLMEELRHKIMMFELADMIAKFND